MSTHKAAGKAKQHVRPSGKRLGPKVGNGQKVAAGTVIVRQSGTKLAAGTNVKVGRDYTLFAAKAGVVKFGVKLGKKTVSIVTSK